MKKADSSLFLLNDTVVSDVFIFQYAPLLGKDAICLYLWMVSKGPEATFTIKQLNETSPFDEGTTSDALGELIFREIVNKKGRDTYFLNDLKKKEVDSYCASVIARGMSADDEFRLKESDELSQKLAESISKTFYAGKMNHQNYLLVDKCLYEYKFDSIVVYKLFETAKEEKYHFDARKIEKTAKLWFDKGYNTEDGLDKLIKEQESIKALIKTFGKLTRRRMNDIDIEHLKKWTEEFGVKPELAEYAFRCNEYRGNITMQNVEDTLSEWYAAGIVEVSEASKYEKEKATDNKNRYARKTGKKSAYRTGKEAGITDEEIKASSSDESTQEGEDEDVSDILSLFGNGADER